MASVFPARYANDRRATCSGGHRRQFHNPKEGAATMIGLRVLLLFPLAAFVLVWGAYTDRDR
jgi:hypothetical protein